jgi:hypothetical protein
VDERFYHRTGAESYYGRKKKFKDFFYIFFTRSICRFRDFNGIRVNLRPELTVSCPEYETLWSLETEVGVDSRMGVRSRRLAPSARTRARHGAIVKPAVARSCRSRAAWAASSAGLFPVLLLLFVAVLPLAGREKNKVAYGEGLIVNIPLPESEIVEVVEEVAQNGVIRGTKEYNKDEFVSGAKAATSSHVFPPWNEGGKVFYKVREQALDPRNFKDSSDSGTLVVRYVVLAQGEKNTVLRIDALFEEDFRHVVHQSSGSVETAEYQDIQEHIEAIEVMKKQNVEAEKERQEQLAKKRSPVLQTDSTSAAALQSEPQAVPQAVPQATNTPGDSASQPGTTESGDRSLPDQSVPGQTLPGQMQTGQAQPGETRPGQALQEHVKDLRRQLERLVKAPGAALKSAPFHTASTLQSLPTGAEVLILISTTYWYGVETHEGQHGWIMRNELDQP